eukprot:8452973-Lingulodinium_polyedra.AAC.1
MPYHCCCLLCCGRPVCRAVLWPLPLRGRVAKDALDIQAFASRDVQGSEGRGPALDASDALSRIRTWQSEGRAPTSGACGALYRVTW